MVSKLKENPEKPYPREKFRKQVNEETRGKAKMQEFKQS